MVTANSKKGKKIVVFIILTLFYFLWMGSLIYVKIGVNNQIQQE